MMTRRRIGAALMLSILVLVEAAPAVARQRRPRRTTSAGSAASVPPAAKPATPVEHPPAEPVAYYVLAADTGTVLAAKDADRQWPPASMAKMMTVLLALEQVGAGKHTLAEPVPVSARAASTGGSQVYLRNGETLPLGDLLAAVMIPSANDAAVAVAEHLAGSVEAFVRRMNARAYALGLTRTTFRTPSGLPPEAGKEPDLSTARDLARLARALMRHPAALLWAGSVEAPFRNGALVMRNTNHLLTRFAGLTGLKTGHTTAGGFSLTASATRGDFTLVAVVLGLSTRRASFDAATSLLSDAFDRYRVLVAAHRGVPVGTVPVSGGTEGSIKAVPTSDLRLVVPRADERRLSVEARIPRQVSAPVAARQALGTLVVRRGDEQLGSVPVVSDADVASAGWLAWLWPSGTAVAAR